MIVYVRAKFCFEGEHRTKTVVFAVAEMNSNVFHRFIAQYTQLGRDKR